MKLNRAESIEKINDLASNKIPFLMISDFKGENSKIWPLNYLNPDKVCYWINGISNYVVSESKNTPILLNKFPISFVEYQRAFDFVKTNVLLGNSFLTNLTCATNIKLNIGLKEIFERSEARYKVLLSDEFVCFSPEIFVKIDESGKISSFPMKGTIDANIPDAENIILSDKKEFYEHTTIVDLIRNDISKVANKVWVEKFRYIDKIQTNEKKRNIAS